MRPQSAKAKGRRLQQEIRDKLLETFTHLQPDDVRSTSMGASGEDILLSPEARKSFPFSIEAKCQEKLNIWGAIEQAEKNSNGHSPILIFRRNHTKTYAVIELETLLKLLKKD